MGIDQIVSESRASQNKDELKSLLGAVNNINPKIIVEIGVHRGYSLEVWKKMWPEAKIIGIDNDLHALDKEATKDCIIIDDNSHLSRCFNELEAILKNKPIDFLFIDGDHTYQGVKRDFEMYGPLVRKGGIIALHDVSIKDNNTVEVYKFWEEIKGNYNNELFLGTGGTGTGVLY